MYLQLSRTTVKEPLPQRCASCSSRNTELLRALKTFLNRCLSSSKAIIMGEKSGANAVLLPAQKHMPPEDFTLCSEEDLINRFLSASAALEYVLPHPYTYRSYDNREASENENPFASKPPLPVLCLDVIPGYEWRIWNKRRELSATLLEMRMARKMIIFSQGKRWLPNQPSNNGGTGNIMNDLMTRLLETGKSGAIVDYQTNHLIWATAQIRDTIGRGLPDIMLYSRDMSALWEPAEEQRREQNLKEQGLLTDYLYEAYAWEQADHSLWLTTTTEAKDWIRVKRKFKAGAMYMQILEGRFCRITESVEIVS